MLDLIIWSVELSNFFELSVWNWVVLRVFIFLVINLGLTSFFDSREKRYRKRNFWRLLNLALWIYYCCTNFYLLRTLFWRVTTLFGLCKHLKPIINFRGILIKLVLTTLIFLFACPNRVLTISYESLILYEAESITLIWFLGL